VCFFAWEHSDSDASLDDACLGHALAQLLEERPTSQKVVGSIRDGVTGIFRRHNPPGRTTDLGSNQLLTEMSTTSISWG
jgi:hypothetical protein